MEFPKEFIFEIDLQQSKIHIHNEIVAHECMMLLHTDDAASLQRHFIEVLLHPDYQKKYTETFNQQYLKQIVVIQKQSINLDFLAKLSPFDKEYQWFNLQFVPGEENKIYGLLRNIHQDKEDLKNWEFAAHHDMLSILLNRRGFFLNFEEVMKQEKTQEGYLLLIDIDNFKTINDKKGHSFGDKVIISTSAILKKSLPPDALIGRYGGDEFIVFIPGVRSKAETYANQICQMCEIEEPESIFSVSIGMATYVKENNVNLHTLIDNADKALYKAKESGKNQIIVYDEYLFSDRKPLQHVPQSEYKIQDVYKSPLTWFVFILGVICLLLGIAFTFQNKIKVILQDEVSEYLVEVAYQVNKNIVDVLGHKVSALEVMEQTLNEAVKGWSAEETKDFIDKRGTLLGYDKVHLVSKEQAQGNKYLKEMIPDMLYWEDHATFQQKVDISQVVGEGATNYTLFLLPLQQEVTLDGETFCMIAGMISNQNLTNLLSLNAFEGDSVSSIINTRGNVVVRSDKERSLLKEHDNLMQALNDVEITTKTSIQTIGSDILAGRSGAFRYRDKGQEYIVNYAQLEALDWVQVASVPVQMVEQKNKDLMRFTMAVCIIITGAFTTLLCIIIFNELKSRKELEKTINIDPITGGNSHAKFVYATNELLKKPKEPYTLICANVQKFKMINDRFGKNMGDRLLKEMDRVLGYKLTEKEISARMFADIYVILLNTHDQNEILDKIHTWSKGAEHYGKLINYSYEVGISFGVYRIEDNGIEPDLLIDRANLALSQAVSYHEHVKIGFYDQGFQEKIRQEKELQDRLQYALDCGEFKIYLQRLCRPITGEVVSYEALIRWFHPQRGFIKPDEFIALFEKNGTIDRIDLYVFDSICKALKNQIDHGQTPYPISFNISRNEFMRPNFIYSYLDIFKNYDIAPNNIVFEITETGNLENLTQISAIVDSIKEYGFLCAMDDFGSGYSSLNMLNQINIDYLKLDRQFFAEGAVLSEKSKKIIKGVVSIAKALEIKVVAEGIEHEEQVAFLQEIHCDCIQGYFYHKPTDMEQELLL